MGARPSALDGVEGYPRHSSASSKSTFERGCESAENMTSDVKRLGAYALEYVCMRWSDRSRGESIASMWVY
eukprot:761772-Pyramimonas_sp.AAC.2